MAEDPQVTATARKILHGAKVFAVVGASPTRSRPSHGVMKVLIDHGYEVIPIRPGVDEIHGRKAYARLSDVPEDIHIDVVDIFRRSEFAGAHVDEAIERGVDAVWMQLGVLDPAAAVRAQEAGLDVVMDRCPAIELRRPGTSKRGY